MIRLGSSALPSNATRTFHSDVQNERKPAENLVRSTGAAEKLPAASFPMCDALATPGTAPTRKNAARRTKGMSVRMVCNRAASIWMLCAGALAKAEVVRGRAVSSASTLLRPNIYVSHADTLAPSVVVLNGTDSSVLGEVAFPPQAGNLTRLAATPDGRRLYVGTAGPDSARNQRLWVIDTVPTSAGYNEVIDSVPVPANGSHVVDSVMTDPQQRFLAVAGGGFQAINFVDLRIGGTENRVVATVNTTGVPIGQPAVDDNGTVWWGVSPANGNPAAIAVLDTSMFPTVNTIQVVKLPQGFVPRAIGLTATHAFVSGSGGTEIQAIDTTTFALAPSLSGGRGDDPNPIAIVEPNMYVVTDNQTVLRVYDTSKDAFLNDVLLDNSTTGAHSLAVSTGFQLASRAYVARNDTNIVHVVDIDQSPPSPLMDAKIGDSGGVNDVAVQPDAETVAGFVGGLLASVAPPLAPDTLRELTFSLQNAALGTFSGAKGISIFIEQVQNIVRYGELPAEVGDRVIDSARYIASLRH